MEKYELENLRRLLEKMFAICTDDEEISEINNVLAVVNQCLKLFK